MEYMYSHSCACRIANYSTPTRSDRLSWSQHPRTDPVAVLREVVTCHEGKDVPHRPRALSVDELGAPGHRPGPIQEPSWDGVPHQQRRRLTTCQANPVSVSSRRHAQQPDVRAALRAPVEIRRMATHPAPCCDSATSPSILSEPSRLTTSQRQPAPV
eukprot:2089208-Pyramimonas_sp.AAC.1